MDARLLMVDGKWGVPWWHKHMTAVISTWGLRQLWGRGILDWSVEYSRWELPLSLWRKMTLYFIIYIYLLLLLLLSALLPSCFPFASCNKTNASATEILECLSGQGEVARHRGFVGGVASTASNYRAPSSYNQVASTKQQVCKRCSASKKDGAKLQTLGSSCQDNPIFLWPQQKLQGTQIK